MISQKTIDMQYEENGEVGIYHFSGMLTADQEDDLKLLLMKALYSTDRAVVNLKDVTNIDQSCLTLLNKAYCTSIRLKSPIIITGIPQEYTDRIFECREKQHMNFHLITDHPLMVAGQEFDRF
jgi:anti-anti-sigma regulatory factor